MCGTDDHQYVFTAQSGWAAHGTDSVPAIAAKVRDVYSDRSNIDQDIIRLTHDLRERSMFLNEGA